MDQQGWARQMITVINPAILECKSITGVKAAASAAKL